MSPMPGRVAPVVRDLVLIGGGHSHVGVLRSLGMRPLEGTRVTVIGRDVHTPYSGMLPGLIAGHYEFDDVHIDLAPLARFAGARLFHDQAVGLDLPGRRVLCRDRPPVLYDVLSINIGSSPLVRVSGDGDVVPVKPINNFLDRWERLRERVLGAAKRLSVAVVGAGAGGVELALAAQHGLRRELASQGREDDTPAFRIFSATEQILPEHNRGARRRLARVLERRGIDVRTGARVVEVGGGTLRCEDGSEHRADEVLWVTEASAAPWLRETGLAVDDRGFVLIDDTLRSISHPEVFAVGDVAESVNHPRPKAGVFAVRQAGPLAENLRRALLGRPLRTFVPQREFLTIISTGDRDAVASRGPWAIGGPLIWRWKDWIDRRFMRRFSDLPAMAPGLDSGSDSTDGTGVAAPAMRCGGCGAKVGATVLGRVLARLGIEASDDAAVLDLPAGGDRRVVQTVDFFPALIDDPFVFGKIAANHALGDIFAMGAEATVALAMATIPPGAESKIEDTLEQLLRGAVAVLGDAGATLVGGHTIEGDELAFGLTVTGTAPRDRLLRKGGMRPGDHLVLTRPIGTGTLFAAHMRGRARGRWITAAVASMLESSRAAAACLVEHGATACTDVTGFGLIGHLGEMARASGVNAVIRLADVPLLDGALECVERGIVSSLQPENLRLRRAVSNLEEAARDPRFALLFDPQTAGGLLASVPAENAAACIEKLRALGCPHATAVGEVTPGSGGDASIRVERVEASA